MQRDIISVSLVVLDVKLELNISFVINLCNKRFVIKICNVTAHRLSKLVAFTAAKTLVFKANPDMGMDRG